VAFSLHFWEILKLMPPRLEQHEIVRLFEIRFAFADRLEARLATARTATARLTPALLAKAFRGVLATRRAGGAVAGP
jgi:hypothetical protein